MRFDAISSDLTSCDDQSKPTSKVSARATRRFRCSAICATAGGLTAPIFLSCAKSTLQSWKNKFPHLMPHVNAVIPMNDHDARAETIAEHIAPGTVDVLMASYESMHDRGVKDATFCMAMHTGRRGASNQKRSVFAFACCARSAQCAAASIDGHAASEESS